MEDITDGSSANNTLMNTRLASLLDMGFKAVTPSILLLRGKFQRKTKNYQQAGAFSLTDSQCLKEKSKGVSSPSISVLDNALSVHYLR